jgi:scyllo-inositol 2-dehydrogenase (NADP+)
VALDSLVETAPGSYEAYNALVRDTLLAGGPPPVDPADSLVVLLVIEAARQSARTGQVVRLDT